MASHVTLCVHIRFLHHVLRRDSFFALPALLATHSTIAQVSGILNVRGILNDEEIQMAVARRCP
jgi:hypothetical protein